MKKLVTLVVLMLIVMIGSQTFGQVGFQTSLPFTNGDYNELKSNSENFFSTSLLFVATGISFIAGAAVMGFIWEITEEQRKRRLHHH